jgi:hypothetical protein
MKKATYILITFLIIFRPAFGQELTKNLIDEFILRTFPTAEMDTSWLYIVNGYPFEYNEINAEVRKYDISLLYTINFLDHDFVAEHFGGRRIDIIEATFEVPRKGIVLLQVGKQSRKSVRELLKEGISKFETDNDNISDVRPVNRVPVLVINETIIPYPDSFETISNLKVKKIKGINIIKQPVSQDYYGENGINGLIMIKLK